MREGERNLALKRAWLRNTNPLNEGLSFPLHALSANEDDDLGGIIGAMEAAAAPAAAGLQVLTSLGLLIPTEIISRHLINRTALAPSIDLECDPAC